MVNIHHLELFYYVARYEGISEAVRNIPYGVQQPAISAQLLQLEKGLGLRLFTRRPFALTPGGRELYAFITPFFANLEHTRQRLEGTATHHLRLGASATVLRDHLPELLQNLQRKDPKLRLTLCEATQLEAQRLLQNQEIDLAISSVEGKAPEGIECLELLQLPLVLVVPRKFPFSSSRDFLKEESFREYALIALPGRSAPGVIFQRELARREKSWTTQIEVDSLELIQTYVAAGFGVGLSVEIPRSPIGRGLRHLPLQGFPPVRVGAFWMNELPPLAKGFLEGVKERARWLVKG